MGFGQIEFNTTSKIAEKGILNKLIGENDVIYLRNKYQTELDNAYAAFVNMVHYIEDIRPSLLKELNIYKSYEKDINSYNSKRTNKYEQLYSILKTETNFEKEMFNSANDTHKSIFTVDNSDISSISQTNLNQTNNITKVVKYLEKYPQYQTKDTFKTIIDEIRFIENETNNINISFNHARGIYFTSLARYNLEIKKAEDKLSMYNNLLNIAINTLNGCRYRNGLFYKLASQKTKDLYSINTTNHRIEQFTNTLNILKKEFSLNEMYVHEKIKY